jgi:hypothetical protein|tara:strand:- start:193 stop:396 length:204 start_codon:yes stop_codon:yes gene_type:complete
MKQDVFDLLLSANESKILYRNGGSNTQMQEDWQKIMDAPLITGAYVAVPIVVMQDLLRKIKEIGKNA